MSDETQATPELPVITSTSATETPKRKGFGGLVDKIKRIGKPRDALAEIAKNFSGSSGTSGDLLGPAKSAYEAEEQAWEKSQGIKPKTTKEAAIEANQQGIDKARQEKATKNFKTLETMAREGKPLSANEAKNLVTDTFGDEATARTWAKGLLNQYYEMNDDGTYVLDIGGLPKLKADKKPDEAYWLATHIQTSLGPEIINTTKTLVTEETAPVIDKQQSITVAGKKTSLDTDDTSSSADYATTEDLKDKSEEVREKSKKKHEELIQADQELFDSVWYLYASSNYTYTPEIQEFLQSVDDRQRKMIESKLRISSKNETQNKIKKEDLDKLINTADPDKKINNQKRKNLKRRLQRINMKDVSQTGLVLALFMAQTVAKEVQQDTETT